MFKHFQGVERSEDETDSVEVTRSSSTGKYGYSAKIYFNGDLAGAKKRLILVDKWFKDRFLHGRR